jgi:hypothetical protein
MKECLMLPSRVEPVEAVTGTGNTTRPKPIHLGFLVF